LADEPTGNLDSATGLGIMTLFDKLHASGNTLIVVTHEKTIGDHADRIVWLRDGDIVSDSKVGDSQ
jgi:putative ABC transport system ATP-binding protein